MRPERLRVGGLAPFSTVDYPGHLSAVLFCQGCPWRCRYCHNPHLQPFTAGAITWPEVEAFLTKRRGLLDAVVFSGGEPTAQPALEAAIRAVLRLGFKVGLHTAGVYPGRLRRVLPLLSWVGLDIKAPFDGRYDAITRIPASWRAGMGALDEVLMAGVAYDLRTTIHPALLDAAAKEAIQTELFRRGARPARWQEFRAQGCVDAGLVH
ncbi:MAG: anaerobic ribonucleoside-triphosphate reductase activating protein [Terrimicrobiaceae bacterium]|nr:anaerobic ribonucleoside-triphosphate reductase activating protein [Terrimicrobiaceae bacterium]